MQLSVDPAASSDMRKAIASLMGYLEKEQLVEEGQAAFEQRSATMMKYNALVPEERAFVPILVSHWVSRLFPMGHIKSVKEQDANFIGLFMVSKKWLRVDKRHQAAL